MATLPCHKEVIGRQKPSKLDKDVVEGHAEAAPWSIIQQQNILERREQQGGEKREKGK